MKTIKLTLFTLLYLSSNSVFSQYNITVKLDEISNSNINHVGNEWCFFFHINNRTTQVEINTTKIPPSDIIYSFKNQIIGETLTNTIKPIKIGMIIVEIDPAYNDYYLNKETPNNLFLRKNKNFVKKRNNYCRDFIENKKESLYFLNYYQPILIKFDETKEKYNEFINSFEVIEKNGRFRGNKTQWKITLSTDFSLIKKNLNP